MGDKEVWNIKPLAHISGYLFSLTINRHYDPCFYPNTLGLSQQWARSYFSIIIELIESTTALTIRVCFGRGKVPREGKLSRLVTPRAITMSSPKLHLEIGARIAWA